MLNRASHKAKLLRPSGEAPSPTTTFFLFDHEEEDRRVGGVTLLLHSALVTAFAPPLSSRCRISHYPSTIVLLNEYSSLRNNNSGREIRAFENTSTSRMIPPRGPARLLPSSKQLLSNNEGNLFGREYPRTGGGGGATYNYHSNSYIHGQGKNIADATSFRDGSVSSWANISPLSSSSSSELSRTAPAASTASPSPSKQYAIGSWKTAASSSSSTLSSLNHNNNDKRPLQRRRRPIVAGNWKCNPATRSEAITLLRLLAANFIHNRTPATATPSTTTDAAADEVQLLPEMVLFIPSPYLKDAISILEGTGIQLGVQTASYTTNIIGPYTGEVTTSMVQSLGCTHVLLGHSERRSLCGETNQFINTMLHNCLSDENGLKIILCVGETLAEYNTGMMEEVITNQLQECLSNIDPSTHILMNNRLCIAYEPIWAIGTGLVATPDQAQSAHETIRQALYTIFDHQSGADVANTVRILYGGSVTPDSVESLVSMEDVDGTLVGGASLIPDSLTRIFDGTVSAATSKMMKASIPNRQMMNAAVKYAPNELIASEVLSTKNILGESPIWSVRDQALYWISSPEGEVWRWDLINLPHRRLMNTVIGCIGLLGQSNSIIVAGESGILYINMDHPNEPNHIVHRPEFDTTTRPNDGRVDRAGNLVLGMYNNYHRAGGPTVGRNNAGLFRLLSSTLQWEDVLCNNQEYRYRVSNCICFSPDGSTLYFSDTPTRTLYAFDYTPTSPLTNRRHVWTMPASMPGALDGAQIDNMGKLWIAVTGGKMVIQLNPISGEIETIVRINANPTSVTFGGPELDELFITTRAPDGGIFRVKVPYGVRGVTEPEFK